MVINLLQNGINKMTEKVYKNFIENLAEEVQNQALKQQSNLK